MTHNFGNIKLDCKLYSYAAFKLKDFIERLYKMVDKLLVMSRFGQSYILEVVGEDDNMSEVYTAKAITEHLYKNSRKYTKKS